MDIWKEIYKTILKDRKKKVYMRALSMTMAGVLVFVTHVQHDFAGYHHGCRNRGEYARI